MMLLLLLAIFKSQPEQPQCAIDQCEDGICTVETPEGTVEIAKKSNYKEGVLITCPTWLVEPT